MDTSTAPADAVPASPAPTTHDLINSVTGSDTLVTADTAKLAADTATDKAAHSALASDLSVNGPAAVVVVNTDGTQSVVIYRATASGDIAADPAVRVA